MNTVSKMVLNLYYTVYIYLHIIYTSLIHIQIANYTISSFQDISYSYR